MPISNKGLYILLGSGVRLSKNEIIVKHKSDLKAFQCLKGSNVFNAWLKKILTLLFYILQPEDDLVDVNQCNTNSDRHPILN